MATCFHCKTEETQLFENGVPICLKCAEARSFGPKPAASDLENLREKLHQDLIRSTDQKGMATAHNRLNDYLARGVVPEDLKRSG